MSKASQKRMLALDGGGLMGLISLGILQRMEDQLRAAHGNDQSFRLRDFFDYIGGTSTGAIIASGLMTGMRVAELHQFFEEMGPEMFTRVAWINQVPFVLSGRKFHDGPLAQKLRQILGQGSILDLQNEGRLPTNKHLMMVMHNLNSDSPWCVSTNPLAKYNQLDHPQCNLRLPLWQLVRASTAAPGYFFPEQVEMTSGDPKSMRVFQDGGLTPHNNPALKLFQMATLPEYRVGWKAGVENLMLVSVGTGRLEKIIKTPQSQGINIGKIAGAAPGWLMAGTSAENDLMCRMLGHCTYGPWIDNEVGDLTGQSPDGKQFTYARYDIVLSKDLVERLELTGRPKDLQTDNVSKLQDFIKIGKEAALCVDMSSHFRGFVPMTEEANKGK